MIGNHFASYEKFDTDRIFSQLQQLACIFMFVSFSLFYTQDFKRSVVQIQNISRPYVDIVWLWC